MPPAQRRAYAGMQTDEYGNVPDIRFLPHLVKKQGAPKRAIALALFLFLFGSVMLVLGVLALGGKLHRDEKGTAREMALALTILGSITFLPGLYYTRIAYYAWKGVPGYSYDQIPETD